jgi:hypothetical protein
MCFVAALGVAMYDAVQIIAPAFTMMDQPAWQSDEQFLLYYPDKKSLPDEERASLRQQFREMAIESERRAGWQSLVLAAIILMIDVVVYAVHWRVRYHAGREAAQRPDTA